jgi:decaprenylphospho-beta-D-erythro-pentofuranosid-2-ulose 2-reductase
VKKNISARAGRPVAIIIGASTGMGAALARKLVDRGFQVALVARQVDKLDALVDYLNASYRDKTVVPVARAYQHDVCDYEAVPGLIDSIRHDAGNDGGEIKLLVYAAGIMPPGEQGRWTFQEEQRTIETNLIGAMAWIGASAEVMKRIGHGTIVGISSVAGDRGRKGNSAYMASKAALTTYLESLRYRLHGTGVRVVTVKPGYVATPMTAGMKLPRPLTISAEVAADSIARRCERGRTVAYVPGYWGLIMLIIRTLPAWVLVRLPI